ncbi:hypothetical protein F4805DRAFT_469070 [Annulohypoxylon moriforme]|nr:hypothetical protein F4805DRAFT_469070 [Annulohypoxylon moriforme]
MVGMGERPSGPLPGPTVLLFGPLALSFDEAAFAQVRKNVVENEDSHWVIDTVAEFPQIWKSLTTSIPSLKSASGLKQLEDLSDAIRTGRPLETSFPLPNKLLIPLVIVSHLTQYATFLRNSTEGEHADPFTVSKIDRETLGLCTGLLSAFAVSSSGNSQQFKKYAAVAVRLAMLIGTVVDAQDEATEPSKSLSAAWNSAEGGEELKRIVKSFPETYVSVNYDDNRATVTTKASAISKLLLQLRGAGLIASEVGLYGRFHASINLEKLGHLLEFVGAHSEFQFPNASSGLAVPTRSNRGGDLITHGPLHQHALQSILAEPPQWFQAVSAVRDATLQNKDSCILSFGPERAVPPSLLRSLNPQVVHVADLDNASSRFEAFSQKDLRTFSDNDVAVVGMSIKVAGAETLDDFWDLLVSAKSQHKEVPKERFGFETAFRDVEPKRKWFGNFIENYDKFDHKFFKKSPRESSTMDPQQRNFLQCAYQAVEQSGYFQAGEPDNRIGCFVGVCSRDYDCNIACHPANAFSATGNLQSFISGKVSHYFGWTGPGLTIDTACSSSAVAIHQACRAIITGECTGALAGGTNVVTNPLWFQNLAGASFLSTTGQCKPFDAKADGYCRGEGVAAVFLKKLSAAVADGDQILGVVAATGVQQNENCTPIFVPNAPSLSDLFRGVTKQARLKPSQISVVEAHGTGTGVGDPAEYSGIRQVLGGQASGREKNLLLGSVKGLIGHTEATSGIVSMVKVMLMIQKGMVPPQPSHTQINPAIGATPADKMTIPTSMQTWDDDFRAALINNYGASGSNASMIITQSPFAKAIKEASATPAGGNLRRYAKVFRKFLNNKSYKATDLSLPNVSFNLARQSNRSLEKAVLFSARSGDASPVVLCFGGQVSTFVGLDQNNVDAVVRSYGAESIFPGIFESTPAKNTYATARSWIDSGIKPAAVVGHSFGELTALAVAQVLSLEDAVKLVINRGTLVRDAWADLAEVEKLLADIACYNGPRSFTLAGSTAAIDARLNVTNSFHCALVDPLVEALELVGKMLTFRKPTIPEKHSAKFIAEHMRSPVYFNHAVQRLAKQYPSAVFLEAGSNSTITVMAGRALGSPSGSHFQAINITNTDKAWDNLVDATINLWKAASQTKEHSPLLLPPYQFELASHWVDYKVPPKPEEEKIPEGLLTFVGYQDSKKRLAKFRINTMIPKYEKLIVGHVIAQTASICPATVQLDLVIEAVRGIRPDLAAAKLEPQVHVVENQSPICVNPSRGVWIEVEDDATGKNPSWNFQVFSTDMPQGTAKTLHTTGKILEFARLERLIGHARCVELLQSGDIFSEVKLVGCGNQSAGHVVKKYNPESWLDAHLADSFCQVGGIYVNCMTDRSPSDMYIANGIEQWIRSPKLRPGDARPDSFHQYLTDVFVFHPETGALLEAILGISYVRIPKASMSKLLSRLTVGGAAVASPSEPAKIVPPQSAPAPKQPKAAKPKSNVAPKVKEILADLSADLGIDSLMAFKISLPESELMEVIDMPSLMACVQRNVGGDVASSGEVSEESEDDVSSDSDSRSYSPSESSSGHPSGLTTPLVDFDKDPYDELSDCDEELKLPFATVMEAFNETKALTDDKILEYGQENYFETVMPLQTDMCVALTLEAFEELGHRFRDARPGDKFARIPHPKEHSRLVDYLYQMLEKESHIINVNGDTITRTAVAAPARSSKEILQDLLEKFPDQTTADKLTFYTGSNLADVLRGTTDGIKLIFGTPEGRDLVSGLYAEWPINRLFYKQMEDFLARLVSKLDMSEGPLKILEMGAGTGGTTRWLVPLLASLNVPVEYTFTDLAPSFVALARKKFKPYPFMKFRTHDIEKAPADELIGTQHIVVASNAVHATHSLRVSGSNIRKALRPDGFLMMLEMTGTLYWVDMIFGLFEGWWFFDDGRTHAVTHELRWEKELQAVGYGHVDWTDGARPENKCEKLIIAMASGERCERLQIPSSSLPVKSLSADLEARQTVVDRYVRNLTEGFSAGLESVSQHGLPSSNLSGNTVLVTGATGSLGSHLIAQFAELPDVTRVVCLNRRSRTDPKERQKQALTKKGIFLSAEATEKLDVFETDMSKANLGLPVEDYENLINNVTHIVHNAWLMNAKWPLRNFEAQFQIMKNLLNLSREISIRRAPGTKVTFQFISSIATVGHRPIWSGEPIVPEERMTIESVLPTGYGDAKYICELMLDETLHKHPDRFRAMVVRPGQIAGSSTSGYWNPMEHLSFLIKSSQTLKALPDFDGLLSWTPVDEVAGTMVDLVCLPEDKTHYPIYHVDNPVRQPWKEMIPVLADALDISPDGIIPFEDWVQLVRDHPRQVEGPEGENPAFLLIDFLDDNFIRMSCGGLLLDTIKVREHSKTLANAGPCFRVFSSFYSINYYTQPSADMGESR